MKSEFDFIQNIKKKYSLRKVGDDCAVLPKDDKTDMVVTADMLIEDIDFRLEWTTPEFLGHKALAVSLSDIAAMGAEPKWAMLSIGVPEKLWKENFLDEFYEGWHKLAKQFDVELIGGDVSRAPEKLVIDSIVGGEVPKNEAILRSGAKVGDTIFVSGKLGEAAGGLKLLESGGRFQPSNKSQTNHLIKRQLAPDPQLKLGEKLRQEKIASSMIDISDGLSSDLTLIREASHVGAIVKDIPVNENLYHDFGKEEAIQMALSGGEDFELLFTVPKEKISSLKNLQVVQIGEIALNTGIIELVSDGQTEILQPKGYRHF